MADDGQPPCHGPTPPKPIAPAETAIALGKPGWSCRIRLCSLIPGLSVKLSAIIPARPTVLSAVGARSPHDGGRWWINVAIAVSLLKSSPIVDDSRRRIQGLTADRSIVASATKKAPRRGAGLEAPVLALIRSRSNSARPPSTVSSAEHGEHEAAVWCRGIGPGIGEERPVGQVGSGCS
jgi:hypothetical protein